MVKFLETVVGSPENLGTRAARNSRATQPPTLGPAKSPVISALVTRPLGANVTSARPVPVGPPSCLQPVAPFAAVTSADLAAF